MVQLQHLLLPSLAPNNSEDKVDDFGPFDVVLVDKVAEDNTLSVLEVFFDLLDVLALSFELLQVKLPLPHLLLKIFELRRQIKL